jgi:4-amino-4-deoxy-L-arabinose transferase-like glycosyltransferase
MATSIDSTLNAEGGLSQNRRIAVGVFFVALAVYTLTYVGAFKSNDERALFSGVDSFVKRGQFTVNQIYWDYTNVGMVTSSGEMVPNYEPGQMALAIPFYLWGRALGAAVQGVMFFNVLVTAATVALVYLCFLELRFGRRTAALGAFVYAFATLAWPYSRTFFREPLTALAYVVAIYALLRYRPPGPRRWRWPALAGLSLGLALVTKQISVAAVPSLLLLAYAYERGRPADPGSTLTRQRLAMALAALAPLALVLLGERIYHAATLGGVELFARNIVEYTTNPQLSQSAPARMMRALLGLSISPYKGLFWYAPALLLGLIGAIPFTRRYRWEGVAFLLLVGAHFLGYSRYNYWSGGVAWGSRYLLPVIPILVLLAGPVLAWLLRDPWRYASTTPAETLTPQPLRVTSLLLRVAAWLLIAVSAAVQVLGVSVDLRTYELRFLLDNADIWGGIGQAIEALYLQPAYSPVLGHLRLLLAGTEPLDFAWVQWREMGTWAFVPAGMGIALAFLAAAVVAFVLIWRRPQRAGWLGLGMAALAVLVTSALLSIYRQGDGRFDPYNVDRFLQPLMERLEQVECGWQGCDQVLLVPDPALTDYFLNYLAAPLVWYATDAEPLDEKLMEQLLGRYGRIWLARDRSAAADDGEGRRGVERWLAANAYKLDEQRVDDWSRLVQFSAAGQPAEVVEPGQTLGDMTLARAELAIERQPAAGRQPAAEPLDDGEVQARPGDVLQLSLHWRAEQAPQGNYTVFVQLLDAAGQVVAQKDRWPGDGLFPTAGMQAGQTIADNLAIPLDVPPGRYRLIVGLYQGDVEGYPRLAGPGGDFIELPAIQVQP